MLLCVMEKTSENQKIQGPCSALFCSPVALNHRENKSFLFSGPFS